MELTIKTPDYDSNTMKNLDSREEQDIGWLYTEAPRIY